MIGFFDLKYQPVLECLFNGIPNIKIAQPISKSLISGAVIHADELWTNVNALIWFVNLQYIWYNLEGVAKTIQFFDATPTTIYSSGPVNTGVSQINAPVLFFNRINTFGAALVNGGTTFNFIGFRLILV
jgi:hypothetical protein